MQNESDRDRKELEALRLAARSTRSINQLVVHRKSIIGEYNERVKRLRRINGAIQQQEQMGSLALDGLDAISLSDDDMALIHNPLDGL